MEAMKMKKLYTIFVVIMILFAMMGITSFAGTGSVAYVGTYRPYGRALVYSKYSGASAYNLDEYDNLITISYVDCNCIIANVDDHIVTYTCSDNSNTYCEYYADDHSTYLSAIELSYNDPSHIMFAVNSLPITGQAYFLTYTYIG